MSRCPYCKKILSDKWIKSQGASMMGKATGQSKARTREQAQAASNARWHGKKPKPSTEEQEKAFAGLRTLAGVRQPKRKS